MSSKSCRRWCKLYITGNNENLFGSINSSSWGPKVAGINRYKYIFQYIPVLSSLASKIWQSIDIIQVILIQDHETKLVLQLNYIYINKVNHSKVTVPSDISSFWSSYSCWGSISDFITFLFFLDLVFERPSWKNIIITFMIWMNFLDRTEMRPVEIWSEVEIYLAGTMAKIHDI